MNVAAMASDEKLLALFLAGDDDAFNELAGRYAAKAYQLALWINPEHGDEAEDIVQEIFIRLHKSAAAFGGRSSFKTWFYGLARITALDWRRSFYRSVFGKISVRVDSENEYFDMPAPEAADDALPDGGFESERLHAAMEKLPLKLKLALMLKEWEEMSYEEIADSMSVPVGTVRSRLHNARALLAGMLRENKP